MGDSCVLKDAVANFSAQWDDEAIQRRGKSSSHRRARHKATAASSWDPQLVSPTFFKDRENATETSEWDVDPEDYEEDADAYDGNDDEWDKISTRRWRTGGTLRVSGSSSSICRDRNGERLF